MRHLNLQHDSTVLDVGCGPGRYHAAISQRRAAIFGVASFGRVLAIHMLYHVPDRLRALQEFRRVLRSGGPMVLATNGVRYLAGLDALHRQAAQTLGYTPSGGDGERFTDPEPLAPYYASGVVDRIADRPADGGHRQPLIQAVRESVQAIIDQEGAFRDPKDYGFIVADSHRRFPRTARAAFSVSAWSK